MLTACLDRLEETIDAEMKAIQARDLTVLPEMTRRKSQSLLELTRLHRSVLTDPERHRAFSERMSRMKEKMDENLALLALQVRATQEISSIINQAIVQSQSDGTYEAPAMGVRAATR